MTHIILKALVDSDGTLYSGDQAKYDLEREFYRGTGYVMRKRYRGPRSKRRAACQRQSMCIKSEATSVTVYLYKEKH